MHQKSGWRFRQRKRRTSSTAPMLGMLGSVSGRATFCSKYYVCSNEGQLVASAAKPAWKRRPSIRKRLACGLQLRPSVRPFRSFKIIRLLAVFPSREKRKGKKNLRVSFFSPYASRISLLDGESTGTGTGIRPAAERIDSRAPAS
jgi:hypothetical protein